MIALRPARTQALVWTDRFAPAAWPTHVRLAPVFVARYDGAEVTRNFLLREAIHALPEGLSHMPLRTAAAARVYPELADLEAGPLTAIDGPAALLCGGPHGADSYWHWLIDYLPRAWALQESGLDLKGLELIVNADLTDVQHDSLVATLGSYRLYRKPSRVRLQVGTLYAPSFLAQTGVVYPEAVAFLRRALAAIAPSPGPERVYLSRRGLAGRGRDLEEEGAVERLLGAHGFAIVRPHDLSFRDQVRALAGARVVVAPHGGGLANTVFAPPGARIVEIATKPRHTGGPSLAAACGHEHRHVAPGPDLARDLIRAVADA